MTAQDNDRTMNGAEEQPEARADPARLAGGVRRTQAHPATQKVWSFIT